MPHEVALVCEALIKHYIHQCLWTSLRIFVSGNFPGSPFSCTVGSPWPCKELNNSSAGSHHLVTGADADILFLKFLFGKKYGTKMWKKKMQIANQHKNIAIFWSKNMTRRSRHQKRKPWAYVTHQTHERNIETTSKESMCFEESNGVLHTACPAGLQWILEWERTSSGESWSLWWYGFWEERREYPGQPKQRIIAWWTLIKVEQQTTL